MRDVSVPGGLDPMETASRDELMAVQLERMKWSLRHAYDNVATYKQTFDERGVHPDDLKSLEDLELFPFTTKATLRDTYPFGLFAVPRAQVSRLHASSGTTGKPVVVGYTKNDLDMWRRSWPGRCARAVYGPATGCTSPTATACSPAASGCTRVPNASAAPSSRSPVV